MIRTLKDVGNDNYVIVIDPSHGWYLIQINKYPLDNWGLRNGDITGMLEASVFQMHSITDSIDLYVDEEGLVNGSIERVGAFTILDSDNETLGQGMYAGRGVLATWDEEYDVVEGWTYEKATHIAKTLCFQSVIG